MRLGLAIKTMFRVMFNRGFADQIQGLLEGQPAGKPALEPPRKKAVRSEALNLLATLQREARMLDFFMESIEGYADAQVGAAVRDMHRSCQAALNRIFSPQPLNPAPEGSKLTVPAGFDPAAYHLTGKVAGTPPYQGMLRHPGWKAARCEVPSWSGQEESLLVITPMEVEIK